MQAPGNGSTSALRWRADSGTLLLTPSVVRRQAAAIRGTALPNRRAVVLPPQGPRRNIGASLAGAVVPALTSQLIQQQTRRLQSRAAVDASTRETPGYLETRAQRLQLAHRLALTESGHLPGRLDARRFVPKGSPAPAAWTKKLQLKRDRARKRLKKFSTTLRASVGRLGILETISMGKARVDYSRRVNVLLDFMARHRLAMKPPEALDCALADYCDFAYLAGENAEHGDKLKAALSALLPRFVPPGATALPRFARTLKGWRKAAPSFSRQGHPEGCTFAVCGVLFRRQVPAMALYLATMLSTYLRPSACFQLLTGDLVDPPPVQSGLANFFSLLLSPQEREGRTKTGEYDCTVLLDDPRHVTLGANLGTLRDAMELEFGVGTTEGLAPLWPFTIRQFLTEYKLAVAEAELGDIMSTPYEERHSGASRDILMKLRTKQEVMDRGHWKAVSSLRNYDKAAKMQQVAVKVGRQTLEYGESVRKDFHTFFHAGIQAGWLLNGTGCPTAKIDEWHL